MHFSRIFTLTSNILLAINLGLTHGAAIPDSEYRDYTITLRDLPIEKRDAHHEWVKRTLGLLHCCGHGSISGSGSISFGGSASGSAAGSGSAAAGGSAAAAAAPAPPPPPAPAAASSSSSSSSSNSAAAAAPAPAPAPAPAAAAGAASGGAAGGSVSGGASGSASGGISGSFGIRGLGAEGYHGRFTARQIEVIRRSPDVAHVEEDTVEVGQQFVVQPEALKTAEIDSPTFVAKNAPWNLDYISHKGDVETNKKNFEYVHKAQPGKNTLIYVLDTGVRPDHEQYKDRFRAGINFQDDDFQDKAGHGTIVAGIAAGATIGVASAAQVVSVKILDKNRAGQVSTFVKAVHWVINDCNSQSGKKCVICYAGAGQHPDATNRAKTNAIKDAIKSGIFVATSAGNDNNDACDFSPSNRDGVMHGELTVGALSPNGSVAHYSNKGPCVNVYAPGSEIISSSFESSSSYSIVSGSSMAAPHVAGLAAAVWSEHPEYNIQQVSAIITNSRPSSMIQWNGRVIRIKLANNNVS